MLSNMIESLITKWLGHMKTFLYYIHCIVILLFILNGCSKAQEEDRPNSPGSMKQKEYSIEQATSQRAQLHTIAFSGLAFITGSFGADTFFPPGKVADFFGFQYMRDNDKNEKGHNTDFLTRIANNVIHILDNEQLQMLKDLANRQAPIYDEFALSRMRLIKAFRDKLEKKTPSKAMELSKEEVIKCCSNIYALDAELSFDRAIAIGKLISSFTDSQREYLAKLDFNDSSTWPSLPENLDKSDISHRAHVGVMTYASELFSWVKGSVKADVYFCPERHGTYFGGFYLKDFPAMGNHNYCISTSLTGDKGRDFLSVLSVEQSTAVQQLVVEQEPLLKEIVQIRTAVSRELRKALNNDSPDKNKVFALIKRYGELDGELSYNCAVCFSKINETLNEEQRSALVALRGLDKIPEGAYLFSDPIAVPDLSNDIQFFH